MREREREREREKEKEKEKKKERECWRNSEAFYRLMEALQGSLRPSEAH